MTRRPSRPCTRSRASTTAWRGSGPMRQVLTGWNTRRGALRGCRRCISSSDCTRRRRAASRRAMIGGQRRRRRQPAQEARASSISSTIVLRWPASWARSAAARTDRRERSCTWPRLVGRHGCALSRKPGNGSGLHQRALARRGAGVAQRREIELHVRRARPGRERTKPPPWLTLMRERAAPRARR